MTMPRTGTVLGGVLVSVGLVALGGMAPASAAEGSPPVESAQPADPALSAEIGSASPTNNNQAKPVRKTVPPRRITVVYKGRGNRFCLANPDGTNTLCVDNAPREANDPTPGATIQYTTDTAPGEHLKAISEIDTFGGVEGNTVGFPSEFNLTSDNMRCDDVAQGSDLARIECK